MALKYQAKPFGLLTDTELQQTVSVLILKIYVITGWAVPQKELKNILIDQLTKKMKEGYSNMNEAEVEFAFRNNLTVKDWGKSINLVLIDEVLSGYLDKREDVSRAEERYRLAPPPDVKEVELSDEDFIEANRAVYKLTKSYGLISAKCYDILVKQEKINLAREQKEEIRIKARSLFFMQDNKTYIAGLSVAQIERFIIQDSKKIAVSLWIDNLIPNDSEGEKPVNEAAQ